MDGVKRNDPKIFSTYNIWIGMRTRCAEIGHDDWVFYGGRGIKVCERWDQDFDAFVADMGLRPEGMTIERINNNGDYEPGNCKWVSRKVQARNRRSNRHLTMNGKTKLFIEWAEEYGIPKGTLHHRLAQGMSLEAALTLPRQKGRDLGSMGNGRY